MDRHGKRADLHIHTALSDGADTAEKVLQLGSLEGLSCIAITDHDHLPSDSEFSELERLSAQQSVSILRGVEISAMDNKRKRKVHILCYLPIDTEELAELCELNTKNRYKAGLEMAMLVADKLNVSVDQITAGASGSLSIFKQHIMAALMDLGFTDDMFGSLYKELFSADKGHSASCFIDYIQPDALEVLAVIRRSRGIAVMAHPFTYNGIDFLQETLEAGLLDGIEVWSSKTKPEQERVLLETAERYGIIPTGGTDYHGGYSPNKVYIGDKSAPFESVEALLKLHELRKRARKA